MISMSHLMKVLPLLKPEAVKGANGIVGVIGGSFEYTGAPYYAAMASVRAGSDLAHIFCHSQAALAIKSYSPELIVHPVFDCSEEQEQKLTEQQLSQVADGWLSKITPLYSKISSWVVGPGLGRKKHMKVFFNKFISKLPEGTRIVIDADGLFFLCGAPQLMDHLRKLECVLTPNVTEFRHLNKILNLDEKELSQLNEKIDSKENENNLVEYVGSFNSFKNDLGVTLVIKGKNDVIIPKNSEQAALVWVPGSKKRCGGIGDVLSGCIAASIHWDQKMGPIFASCITRFAAHKAYKKHGRSLTGLGALDQIESTIQQLEQKFTSKDV